MDFAPLLEQSNATDAFTADAMAYRRGEIAERITLARHAPRVKVVRLIAQLAAAEPQLAVDGIYVDAWSGCSDFRGTVRVREASGETHEFDFLWDCEWRAREQGWTDHFGFPDQIRAAREFGWRCFQRWERRQGADAGDQVGAGA
jgi:hypothetical protein